MTTLALFLAVWGIAWTIYYKAEMRRFDGLRRIDSYWMMRIIAYRINHSAVYIGQAISPALKRLAEAIEITDPD